MNPAAVYACWNATTSAESLLTAIELRLVAAGAVTELRQFYGLSAQEQDVLIRRELGWGPQVDDTPSPTLVPTRPRAVPAPRGRTVRHQKPTAATSRRSKVA